MLRKPEWTDVQLDTNHWTTIEIIGGRIIHSIPRGRATGVGVRAANLLHQQILSEAIDPDATHVHVSDYTSFDGATIEARRMYAAILKDRPGLQAVVFHNVPPLLQISIRLARLFREFQSPIVIAADYADAMRRALAFLGMDETTVLASRSMPTQPDAFPETGLLDLRGYSVRYEAVDRNIVRFRASGHIDLEQMRRNLELEKMVFVSVEQTARDPVLIIDISDVESVSAAARRFFVSTLRERQKTGTNPLYIFHGIGSTTRTAIGLARVFLPFRVRTATNEAAALEIARRHLERSSSTLDRIRSGEFSLRRRSDPPPDTYVNDLLDLMSKIEWESADPVEVDWEHAADHPLAPVVEAFELIKADVGELLRTRAKTERALRSSEARYRNILDSIVDGYYEIDLEGRLLFFNDPLPRIFGYEPDEVDELQTTSLLDQTGRDLAIATFRHVLEHRQPVHTEDLEMQRKDGSTVHVETSISLITDENGQAVGFRGILRDISRRVATARENEALEMQLQRSQRREAIGTLAGGIAHNFNNLLMGIQGNISLLLRQLSTDPSVTARLETIENLVESGSRLTTQLLGYARAGQVEVRTVDLNSLVTKTTETFGLARRDCRIHLDLTDGELPVSVDTAQIDQAMLNLLINAAEAMPGGGDITVSTRELSHSQLVNRHEGLAEGCHALVSVSDTGHGMDRDTMEHIFEPFFTTKGLSGGTGLGLASTDGIVRANGGSISVQSEVAVGTTFELCFPLAPAAAASTVEHRGVSVKGEGTILVVEDDEAVLEACVTMLSLLEYTPIAAGSGREALDIFDRRWQTIDLVILDLILSDIGGAKVFDTIRTVDPSARVLLASGYSIDGEAASLMDRGCDDFIQKPFTIEQLSQKIEGLLKLGDE